MSKKNRFSKSVAFNILDEQDCKILMRIESENFSGYVKSLILADIAREEECELTYVEESDEDYFLKVTPTKKNGVMKIVIE